MSFRLVALVCAMMAAGIASAEAQRSVRDQSMRTKHTVREQREEDDDGERRVRRDRHRVSEQRDDDSDRRVRRERRNNVVQHRVREQREDDDSGRRVRKNRETSAEHHRVGERPRQWCGWWMRTQRGGGPELNLAWNWSRWGRPTVAQIGAVVVWPHHVGEIVGKAPNGQWIVRSGNDGGAVRTRARSVAGAVFRI